MSFFTFLTWYLFCLFIYQGVSNYIKYVSHSAPSARFDISAQYEFFYKASDESSDDEGNDDSDSDSEDEDEEEN